MRTAEGTPTYSSTCTFLFRATPRRDPNRTLFVRKPTSETPAAGTSRATPPGPRDATDQPQRLPKVSSRHFGDALRVRHVARIHPGSDCKTGHRSRAVRSDHRQRVSADRSEQ